MMPKNSSEELSVAASAPYRLMPMAICTAVLLLYPFAVWVALGLAHFALSRGLASQWIDRALYLFSGASICACVEVSVRSPLDRDALAEAMAKFDRLFSLGAVALGVLLIVFATVFARKVDHPLNASVDLAGQAQAPWGIQTLTSSLLVWAVLIAYRLKPLWDAYGDDAKRRRGGGMTC